MSFYTIVLQNGAITGAITSGDCGILCFLRSVSSHVSCNVLQWV